MVEILPSENAKALCLQWIKELDDSDLGSFLKKEKCGKMLGLLICTDNTVLKAYSGDINLSTLDENSFVPQCFDRKEMNRVLHEADEDLANETNSIKKREISRNYWEKVKKLYNFTCFDFSNICLSDIGGSIKSGTGDCCAPRLLSYCYSTGRKPMELAEFFYGSGSYDHCKFYPPCEERCRPILKYITGIDIIYQDCDIVVVNKQHGVLSIEGKGQDKQDCIASRVRSFYNTIKQPCVHRLDQATGGLMVLAKTQSAHDKLCLAFENREVYKEYVALVEGRLFEDEGIIDLPMRLDTNNRPHQIVDFENGKTAVTRWKKVKIEKLGKRYVTRLILTPETGRTHQLRIHCAEGLKHQIVNDPLYGNEGDGNLKLFAKKLCFNHPTSGKPMIFELEPEF